VAHFREDDFERMKKNVMEVLDSNAPRSKQAWSNPKTGSSGFAEIQSQFVASDGATCKRLHVGNKAEGFNAEGTYTMCKQQNGEWKLHLGEFPQDAASKAR